GSMAVNEWVGCFVGPDGKWVPGYQGSFRPGGPGDAEGPTTPGNPSTPDEPSNPSQPSEPNLPVEPTDFDRSDVFNRQDMGNDFICTGVRYYKNNVLVGGGIVIDAYQGSQRELTIPNSIDGLPVVSASLDTDKANLSSTELTSIRIEPSTTLTEVVIDMQELETLDIGECPSLKALYINQAGVTGGRIGRLSALDLTGCPNLTHFGLDSNAVIKTLDLSSCSKLEEVNINRNRLTSLSLEGLSALKSVDCTNNALASLDISGCTALAVLNCYDNNLTALDADGCGSLRELNCAHNKIASLSLRGCDKLLTISISDNNLQTFDPSALPSLKVLSCGSGDVADMSKIEAWGIKDGNGAWIRKDLV
ncbi:hypothetical protein D1643_08635, partial [Enterorhabdus sp. P55]|nr:hypothetical protein [Enterorhabdus sp. P55]